MHTVLVGVLCVASSFGAATPVDEEVRIEGKRLVTVIDPRVGAAISQLFLAGTERDLAGEIGLLQEGFGVGSFYVPNRRLNTRMEISDAVTGKPQVIYTYDCDGPNIKGLSVTRLVEPILDEAAVRVTWRVENKGSETQWVAPWVRHDVAPGGSAGRGDIINVPGLTGIKTVGAADNNASAYYPASRNWAAVTDPQALETVYAVCNADQLHSVLALYEPDDSVVGAQTCFVPRLMKPGDVWETVYRIGVVRGLQHIDFATDELAAQLDFDAQQRRLILHLASVKALPAVTIEARVMAENGRVWRLPAKRFELDPGKVIRCTYDWEAPAPGAYDFLAQLQQGDKPLPLGGETASPHGGIDTKFFAGSPADADLPAWTDAPFLLDRGQRTLSRALASGGGDTAIWFEPSLEKVFPNDAVTPKGAVDPNVRIAAARNESESFQIVLRPREGAALRDLRLRVNDLVHDQSGARIPAENVQVLRPSYYDVRVPSYFEGPTGQWPDALPTFTGATLPGGVTTPLWLTVYVPGEAAPGEYTALMELTSPDLDPVELWLKLTVHDFALPVTPALKTDFGFRPDDAQSACEAAGYKGAFADLMQAYLESAARHRVTLRQLAQLPPESNDYASALKAYEERLAGLRAVGTTTYAVPQSLLDVPEQLRVADAFVAKSLPQRAFSQIAEEPMRPAWPRIFERAQTWKQNAPNVPLMATALGLEPFLHDPIDIWAVHLPVMDTTNNKQVIERIRAGGEVWGYVNHSPSRPYGNFFIDFAALEHRILFWQTWALGLRGFHYWCVNQAPEGRNPWVSQLDITPVNGDGFLVYPSAKGPVSSIRWEAIRDGIEDFDYLVLLSERVQAVQKKGGNAALIKQAEQAFDLKELVPDLVRFSRDTELFTRKREAIAEAIVALGNAL